MNATQRRENPCRKKSSRPRGFTLLEVLLTLGLMAMLLTSLWSLFNVFSRLFETAPVKAAQARLVAGIVQQLSDDLQSAIEDNVEVPSAAGSAGPVRRFGLAGDSNWLRVDVLQALPLERPTAQPGTPAEGPDHDSGPRVPELHTIIYRCAAEASEENPAPAPAESASGESGLTRWEIDFETPPGASAAAAGPARDRAAEQSGDPLDVAPADASATRMPEIVGLEFRYFDGSGWSGSWNSLEHKSLPMAVEVTLHVREADPTALRHRFVIYMPGAKSRPSLHSPELASATAPSQIPSVQPVEVQPARVQPVEVRPMSVPAAQVPQPAATPYQRDRFMRNPP